MPRSSPVVALLSLVSSLLVAASLCAQTAPTEPAAPAWEPIEVSGRVVTEDGAPRTGLAVRLERAPLDGSPTPEPVAATTDEMGVFRARVPEPGFWRATLVPRPDGGPVTVTLPYVTVVEPRDLGDLTEGEPTVERGPFGRGGFVPADDPPPLDAPDGPAPLRVRVVAEETGEAIAGAVARYQPDVGLWGRSDARGELVLPALPDATADARLVVLAAGRVVAIPRLDSLDPATPLTLTPAAELAGHAVDGAGNPLAGVLLAPETTGSFRQMAHYPAVRTGADGAFSLSLALGAEIERLLARHPDRAPAEHEVPALAADERRAGLVVVVPAGLRAVGTVLDPLARPVEGATVRLLRRRETRFQASEPTTVTTDSDGRFTALPLAEGTYDLAVDASGHPETWRRGLELVSPGDDRAPVDLGVVELEPGVRVAGLVTDDDRQPLVGVQVDGQQRIQRSRIRLLGPAAAPEPEPVVTDDDGRFVLVDLQAGVPVRVTARHGGFLDATVTVTPSPPEERDPVGTEDDPVLLVLSPAAAVVGLVETPGGDPVAGARVRGTKVGAGPAALFGAETLVTDDEGTFVLERLSPGRIEVSVEAEGWPRATETLSVEAGGEPETVVITLEPGGDLTGVVTDAEGLPLAQAAIQVYPADQDPDDPTLFAFHGRQPATRTDADGAYSLPGLPTGERLMRVDHPRFAPRDERIVLAAGPNRRDFQLTDGGLSVAGRVVAADGTAVAGAHLSFTSLDSERRGFQGTQTASDGSFVLEGLPPERLDLSARKDSLRASREVDLTAGPVDGLEIVLGGQGRIVGRLVGLDERRLRQVQVLVAGPSFHQLDVAQDGTFAVDSLAVGDWTVLASTPDGRTVSEEIVLEAGGQEVAVELDLTPGEITLDGLLRVDGSPAGGHLIRLVPSDLGRGSRGRSAQSDYAGRFRLTQVEPGTYRLTVRSSQGTALHERDLDVSTGGDLTLEVATVTVSGSVVDPTSGSGLADVQVRLIREADLAENGDNPFVLLGGSGDRTDESGQFEIGPLAAEAYRLVVGDQEPSAGQRVDLSSGRDVVGLVVSP